MLTSALICYIFANNFILKTINMKKDLLVFIFCCMAMGTTAQIQVDSNGDLNTNDHEIYVRNQATSKYGIGYGAFNALEMSIFSDEYIDFCESDDGYVAARFRLNKSSIHKPHFDFRGSVTMESQFWSGGITTDTIRFANLLMPCLYPATHWYAALGQASKRYSSLYVDHAYITQYTTYPSDARVKENVKDIENGLNKVLELRPISYDIKESFYDSILDKEGKQYAMEHGGKNRIGFISQEVQQVMPELVSEEPQSGLLGINTIDMIPYLVQAIKEQQKEIEDLKKQLHNDGNTAELKSTFVFYDDVQNEAPASLSQNKPNPFSSETRIEMFVPKSVANATLYVYDLQGKQVKSIAVTGRGATFETIQGSELQAGLYIYSLVTDGKLVGSKQMVLTE